MFYIIPSIIGNVLLWKSDRNNKAALLAGLYVVSRFCEQLLKVEQLTELTPP